MSTMIRLKFSGDKEFEVEVAESPIFPKYAKSLINLANFTCHATYPRVVGQMTDLIQEFKAGQSEVKLKNWLDWYMKKHPKAIDEATDMIYAQLLQYVEALKEIDENTVRTWVLDLVVNKSFQGLLYQEICIKKVAEYFEKSWRLASASEESKGIDGYIDCVPVQVKKEKRGESYHMLMDLLPPQHRLITYKTGSDRSFIVGFDSDILGTTGV